MKSRAHIGLVALAASTMMASLSAYAGQIKADFAKPVFVKSSSKVCISDDELTAMLKGAPAQCFKIKADLPIKVIRTHLTGLLGSGPMHVEARSPALITTDSFYVNAEDLKN